MPAFVANTNVLDLIGLKNEIADTFINDATVTVTINDASGTAISGASWPVTMSYLATTDGNYRAFLANTLPLIGKAKYTAVINANGGANLVGHWEFHFKPIDRSVQDA